jgi:signal transduction histidine kinase
MGLRLILQNLLANAIKHGRPSDPSAVHNVRLLARNQPFGKLRLVVEDEGDGVPPRDKKRIFELFYRSQETVGRQIPGSGLGLHIVRRVVALLDGKLALESPYEDISGAKHTGCRFAVDLPVRRNSAHA